MGFCSPCVGARKHLEQSRIEAATEKSARQKAETAGVKKQRKRKHVWLLHQALVAFIDSIGIELRLCEVMIYVFQNTLCSVTIKIMWLAFWLSATRALDSQLFPAELQGFDPALAACAESNQTHGQIRCRCPISLTQYDRPCLQRQVKAHDRCKQATSKNPPRLTNRCVERPEKEISQS